jgi:hypothetical protein
VAQLVEALRYKPEGRSEFLIDVILPAALWSTESLTEISSRNISWEVKAAGA